MVSPLAAENGEAGRCNEYTGRSQFLSVGSWNVEGLTEIKLHEICMYMKQQSIHIMCIQEARKPNSDHYVTQDGFLVVLSGTSGANIELAGVGFIVAPFARYCVAGYWQVDNRIAFIKVALPSGKFAITCVYAPHNMKEPDEKLQFYDKLQAHLQRISALGCGMVVGDWNVRLGRRRTGEEDIMGEYGFGREAMRRVDPPNRDLFTEFCSCFEYVIANTFYDLPPESKVTYHEPSVRPNSVITEEGFNVLDLFVMPLRYLHAVCSLKSDRSVGLASHHFPVVANLKLQVPKVATRSVSRRLDWSALQQPTVRRQFVAELTESLKPLSPGASLTPCWQHFSEKAWLVAHKVVPEKVKSPNKPWISQATLHLIAQKHEARQRGDWPTERCLRKDVKVSAKRDRAIWLEAMTAAGDWASIRRVCRKKSRPQGRLNNLAGNQVASDERAETFAEHLSEIQWKVRHVTLIPGSDPALHPLLPVDVSPFSDRELRKALQRMRSGKAAKPDDIPAEMLKALADEPGQLDWLLDFCNECWAQKHLPDDWLVAMVALIYKKGDPAICDNYRPICLISVASKAFAAMLKQRLVDSGIDERIWPSQFGFRGGRSTEDAIFVARRQIELARAQRSGGTTLVALDWKKAFDSIHVGSMLDALRRLGIPEDFRSMVESMMAPRKFIVRECNTTSTPKEQKSGISQGCTLSPLLFILVMTVLLHDAVESLSREAQDAYKSGALSDCVYADDTLLFGVSSCHLNEYLKAITVAGARYGMELHWNKFQVLPVQVGSEIEAADGTQLQCTTRMQYLGAHLAADGDMNHELGRKIAFAKHDFQVLRKLWSHSSLTWPRKLYIYNSLIESRLFYSLASVCLTKAQQRRLDGFQNKFLCYIIGVKPEWLSRVSNAEVLSRTGHTPASKALLYRQLQMFGKILRSQSPSPLRDSAFIPGTMIPTTDRYVRRVGRPCKEFVKEMIQQANVLFGNVATAAEFASHRSHWNDALRSRLRISRERPISSLIHAPPGV